MGMAASEKHETCNMKHETSEKLIVANWKMNPQTFKEAERLFQKVQEALDGISGILVVLCPPFPYLKCFKGFRLGAQDCFWEQGGAYTGAVSPAMLQDIGCEYVIIGHSERKQYFGETDEIISKKIFAALKAGLQVVLCVGEDSRDSFDGSGRWTGELDPKIKEQLVGALSDVKKSQIKNIAVAYEPVWAIGTGHPATTDDVLSAKIFIKKIVGDLYGRRVAERVRILYGGSTNRKNAVSFVKDGGVDGLLVGGSSLDIDEFIAMIRSIHENT